MRKSRIVRLPGILLLLMTLPSSASQGQAAQKPTPLSAHRTPKNVPRDHFQFVRIPAGTFLMGSPAREAERDNDELQHQVTISRPFEMQTTLVTQALWLAVMGSKPSEFKGLNLPVEQVSWDDVQVFIGKLNRMLGTKVYRLPTEAEWEYAARAGTTTPFWTGNNLTTDQANYNGKYPYNGNAKGDYRFSTTPVRTFKPNPWGLYDMHGNVYQWLQDWYDVYDSWSSGDPDTGSVTDPTGPDRGSWRVYRGCSWSNPARHCRSAARGGSGGVAFRHFPSEQNMGIGFRLARSST